MPIVKLHGIELYYEVTGSGPPVLLSHGIGSNHLHWWQQVPFLSEHFTVITFDHRGFGFSSEDGKGPAAFIDDLTGLLDHLSVEKVGLLGQSMGGYTVAGFANRHPERVAALILSSSAAGMVPVAHHPSMKVAFDASDYMAFLKITIDQDSFRARRPQLCFLYESMAQLNRAIDLKLLSTMREIKNSAELISRAGIPTLLISGADDPGVTAALATLETQIEGARLTVVENEGHLFFFENAKDYNPIVGDFFREHLR